MKKQIIVPTDFSANANNAAIVAANVAKNINADLTFVHVYERPVYNLPDLAVDPSSEVEIMNFIHSKMDGILSEPSLLGLDVKQVIKTDCSLKDFTRTEPAENADLIVLGSNGQRSGLGEQILGSNADYIIRSANCPVLTVKDADWDGQLNNLVFASLFDGFASTTFQKIKDFAQDFGATINLLYVQTPRIAFLPSPIARQEMRGFANDWGLTDYTINETNAYSFEEGLFHFANKCNAEVISMTTHVETKLSHLLIGSTAEDVANKAIRPVLTVNTKDDISNSPLFLRSTAEGSLGFV